jgi:Cu/Ag efflux protein CusF
MPAIRTFDGQLAPMASMTMPFAPTPSAPIGNLTVGDKIAFEFTVHYDATPTLRLTRVEKLPPGTQLSLP